MDSTTDPRRFPFPPGIPFAAWLLGWGLGRLWPIAISWPSWTRPLGIILMVLAFSFAGWAVVTFRRHNTVVDPRGKVSTIVTTGPYRVTRNPMYVSLMVLYTGGILAFHLMWSVILLPAVFLALQYGVIVREERYLQAAFGEPYTVYCRQVRRWL
jgi:protein-S-isoprenylcysteine O-methyltransferase Ste14